MAKATAKKPKAPPFEDLPEIHLADGRKIKRSKRMLKPIDELNCCRIKGYVSGSAAARAVTGRQDVMEDRTLRNGANASASALSPNTYDTAADAGSLLETKARQEEDFILHIVRYDIAWQFTDWCRSVSVVCDYSGDISGRQEWLPPEGALHLTSSTRYEAPDFNARNLGGLQLRFTVVDQTGETLVRTLTIGAPPPTP